MSAIGPLFYIRSRLQTGTGARQPHALGTERLHDSDTAPGPALASQRHPSVVRIRGRVAAFNKINDSTWQSKGHLDLGYRLYRPQAIGRRLAVSPSLALVLASPQRNFSSSDRTLWAGWCCQDCTQAVTAETYATWCSSFLRCCTDSTDKAADHSIPRVQAAIAAQHVIKFSWSRLRRSSATRPKASCQCPAFSEALMAAL